MPMLEMFQKAVEVGTPIIGVLTPDQYATVIAIKGVINAMPEGAHWQVYEQDSIRGVTALSPRATERLREWIKPDDNASKGRQLAWVLMKMQELPADALLIVHNTHHHFRDNPAVQGMLNLRDTNKKDGRVLVLMTAQWEGLPVELSTSMVMLEETFPTDEELASIIRATIDGTRVQYPQMPEPDPETVQRAVVACRGLPGFITEQSVQVSLTVRNGLDLDKLWYMKTKMIEHTRGISFVNSELTFGDVGGLEGVHWFYDRLFSGPEQPNAIVWVDELEKFLAGATQATSGDNGVSRDMLGVLLRSMEDNGWSGLISVGAPGTGKSLIPKVLGQSYRTPVLSLDLTAVRGSLMGESERNIRLLMQLVYAIAERKAFFVATCNDLSTVPPELRRRFRTGGIWYHDLPNAEERSSIWRIHLERCGLDPFLAVPDSTDWTGSDIANCCDTARALQIPVIEVAEQIVPVKRQDPDLFTRLRGLADGRWQSASYRGIYQSGVAIDPSSHGEQPHRRLNMGE